MSFHLRAIAAAATAGAALAALAGPAHASKVIVVEGDRTVVRDDPSVPSRAHASVGRERAPGAGAAAARGSAPRARASASRSTRGRRAVSRGLRSACRAKRISRFRYAHYRHVYAKARSTRRRLRGARGAQLGYVIVTVERISLRGRLRASRLPALFLELQRNYQYWPHRRYPSSGTFVTFRGSEIIFQYYPGRGLQIQPLATFKKANNLHGYCAKHTGSCRPDRLARLLDEMTGLAVWRSRRFVAWEYMFDFDGGAPPWMSAMAQSTALQAYARAAQLLGRPDYLRTARRALGAFEKGPPLGVRTHGFRGGVHYLQYSFAPRLYIFNAFTQALLGLYDYGKLTGDTRATRLFQQAEPELEREVPKSNVGDWSRYSYRGNESTPPYHELLREVLESMCVRSLGDVYCTYAQGYRDDQTKPAALRFRGPETARRKRFTAVRFGVSKLSVVEMRVYKGHKLALRRLATIRRGRHAFFWRPRSSGEYRVRLACKELRTGRYLRTRTSGLIEVE
jgi:hypothetical protein